MSTGRTVEMSQENRENEEQNEEPTNSSEISSSTSSCTTTSGDTTTSSSITSFINSTDSSSSSSIDEEGDNANVDNNATNNLFQLRPHGLCPTKSTGLSGNGGDDDGGRESLNANHKPVIDGLQSTMGQQCDTKNTAYCPCSSKSEFPSERQEQVEQQCQVSYPKSDTATSSQPFSQAPQQHHLFEQNSHTSSKCDKSKLNRLLSSEEPTSIDHSHDIRYHLITNTTSLASSYSNLSSTTSTLEPDTNNEIISRRTLQPAPSPSPSMSIIDSNNNRNNNSFCSKDGLSSIKRTNFSKSASGSRLISRSKQNVCDCLTQDCKEKRHSNRRQFIEHYYNSRTQLPSANTSTSSFNISTPLNRLSECDAITRRLLSSPIRTTNLVESPTRRVQVTDVDMSRRASLGTNSITDQVFLFDPNSFKSPEATAFEKTSQDNQDSCAQSSSENDFKLKQQGRSLSVCDEETLNPRQRVSSTNYPSNLNRAISLACESGSSTRRLLTMIPLFGCDIKSLEQFTKYGLILPPVINSAVDHILIAGINSIGIFRKSGVKSRILTLRQRIESNQNIKFDEINQNNEFSIYDIADLVKMWFRELKPLPLMTKELIKLITVFLNTSNHVPLANVMKRGNSSQHDTRISTGRSNISTMVNYLDPSLRRKIDSITTPTHRALLLRVLNFLAQISAKCEANQMTSQNLAICLTPSLCATDSDQNSIVLGQKALEFCIDNHGVLFGL